MCVSVCVCVCCVCECGWVGGEAKFIIEIAYYILHVINSSCHVERTYLL